MFYLESRLFSRLLLFYFHALMEGCRKTRNGWERLILAALQCAELFRHGRHLLVDWFHISHMCYVTYRLRVMSACPSPWHKGNCVLFSGQTHVPSSIRTRIYVATIRVACSCHGTRLWLAYLTSSYIWLARLSTHDNSAAAYVNSLSHSHCYAFVVKYSSFLLLSFMFRKQ